MTRPGRAISELTLPSRTMTSRSAYAATRASWVTSTTVVPCSRAAATSRSITCSPVSESSEPVGSSANSTSGSATSAAGQRDPLRLAAGQLARTGAAPARPGRAARTRPRPRRSAAARRAPPSSSGSATFSSAVSSGTSWPNWNTNPNRSRRSALRSVSLHGVDPPAVEPDLAGVGHQDAGQAVQQRRLARAARAHHGERSRRRPTDDARRRAARASGRRTARRPGPRSARSDGRGVRLSRGHAAPPRRARRAGPRSGRSSAGRPRGGTGRGRRAARRPGRRCA